MDFERTPCALEREYYLEQVSAGINLFWRTLAKMRDVYYHRSYIEFLRTQRRGGYGSVFRIDLSDEMIHEEIPEIVCGITEGVVPDNILLSPSSSPADLGDILTQHGFEVDSTGAHMAIDLSDLPPSPPFLDGTSIVRACTRDYFEYWVAITNLAVNGKPLFTYDQCVDLKELCTTQFYLAIDDFGPGSVCMTVSDGYASVVELVATLPCHRGIGLERGVLYAALDDLRDQGVTTATLSADANMIETCEGLGFREVCPRMVASYGL